MDKNKLVCSEFGFHLSSFSSFQLGVHCSGDRGRGRPLDVLLHLPVLRLRQVLPRLVQGPQLQNGGLLLPVLLLGLLRIQQHDPLPCLKNLKLWRKYNGCVSTAFHSSPSLAAGSTSSW